MSRPPMTHYKKPFTSPCLIKAYSEACLASPMSEESLATRVKLLKEIMDQRRESVETHYREESGQDLKKLGYNLDVKG